MAVNSNNNNRSSSCPGDSRNRKTNNHDITTNIMSKNGSSSADKTGPLFFAARPSARVVR